MLTLVKSDDIFISEKSAWIPKGDYFIMRKIMKKVAAIGAAAALAATAVISVSAARLENENLINTVAKMVASAALVTAQ